MSSSWRTRLGSPSVVLLSLCRSWRWQLVWAALLSSVLAWQLPVLREELRPPDGVFLDFSQEWLSAQNLVHRRPIYEDQALSVRAYTEHRPGYLVRWNAHPPTSVLLGVPFTGLGYPTAHLVWNLLSLLSLALSLFVLAKHLAIKAWMLVPATTLLLVCWPFHLQVQQGQLTLILLLLLVSVWALDRTDRPHWAGAFAGVAAAIKLFPAFLFVYFALRRRWQALGAGVACLAVLTGLTVVVEGWESYFVYATEVTPHVAQLRSSWVNASLVGFWARLFAPQSVGNWRVLPLWWAPSLAWAGTALCVGMVLTLMAPVVWGARCREEGDRAFALTITAMLLVSPITWADYFLFLLLPAAWLWLHLPHGWPRGGLVAALVPLCLPPRALYFLGMGLDTEELGSLFREKIATPWQALTILSLPCYAIGGLFLLGVFEARHARTPLPELAPLRR